jgi:hypothetical protein
LLAISPTNAIDRPVNVYLAVAPADEERLAVPPHQVVELTVAQLPK